MELFKYIETIFFVSLAITFLLILMLVYHFKDRISHLEQKMDTIFEIMNNMVKEMMVIKTQCSPMVNPFSRNTTHNVYIPTGTTASVSESFPTSLRVDKIVVSDDEDEEDDDDYDGDDDDWDEEEDEDNKVVVNVEFLDGEILQEEVIPISLTEEESKESRNIESTGALESLDISMDHIESSTLDHTDTILVHNVLESAEMKQYKKMDIPTLRSFISTKGSSVDTSKMKKKDLIQLLLSL